MVLRGWDSWPPSTWANTMAGGEAAWSTSAPAPRSPAGRWTSPGGQDSARCWGPQGPWGWSRWCRGRVSRWSTSTIPAWTLLTIAGGQHRSQMTSTVLTVKTSITSTLATSGNVSLTKDFLKTKLSIKTKILPESILVTWPCT